MFEQKLYLHLSKLKTILMLFIITRASYNYDEQPHPKARKKIIPNYSIHENWTEAYYNSISPNKLWRSVGTGHTTINKDAGIKRQQGTTTVWVISFSSLSKLMEFITYEGRIIIAPKEYNEYPTIKIYDDYIE